MKNAFILGSLLIILFYSCDTMDPITDGIDYEEGLIEQNFTWQDMERTYWLHLPPTDKMNSPLPILFHLHGGGGTGNKTPMMSFGKFDELADKEGFIVVYPDAIDKNWADGRTAITEIHGQEIDDVGFIIEIIDRLQESYTIDEDKIFTTGMSNGGFMSTRLMCDKSDVFRGGAILTASISEDYLSHCSPSNSVGILIMNGTADELVPYEGGEIVVDGENRGKVISHDEYVDFWLAQTNCTQELATDTFLDIDTDDDSTVELRQFENCNNSAALKVYEVIRGGHTWPGGWQYLPKWIVGTTNRDINAAQEIWDFFSSLE